ncbi:MAG: ECF transporter S component [Saccharofermentanales bacterium]
MKVDRFDTDPSVSSTDPSTANSSDIPKPGRTDAIRAKTLRLTQLAMLSAIIIVMAFTPLGYLKIGPLSITFLTIPVVLGAIFLGPIDGAILGAVFGATSFAQCFGLDFFGTTLLSINPVFTFILCFLPRMLIGIVSGYLQKGLEKVRANQAVSYALSALAGALTNTVFFVGFLLLFFGKTEYIQSFGSNLIAIIGVLVTTNSLVEAIACTVIVTILAKTLVIVFKRARR